MRRYLPGLRSEASAHTMPLEGIFLVEVENALYQYHRQKPFLTLRLIVLEPEVSAGRSIVGRLYCSAKSLWKVRWFLRDFGYDEELIGRDLVDGKALSGLRGVVRVSEVFFKGSHYPSLDSFAPAETWQSRVTAATVEGSQR
jgi:hypothetical protein